MQVHEPSPEAAGPAETVSAEAVNAEAVSAEAVNAEAIDAEAVRIAAPEVIAGSLSEYARIWLRRVRSGESGVLPVVLGLAAIVAYFQARSSLFLSAGNLVNLMIQGAPFILLGMAEVFVLLLGEIDLSVGSNALIGATVTAWTVYSVPGWLAILAGLATTTAIGALQGILITRLRLPSFVVTLAALIGLQGLLIVLVARSGHGPGGSIRISDSTIDSIANGNMTPVTGWILMVVIVVLATVFMIARDRSRRASRLSTPPASITGLKVSMMAVAGVAVVVVGNTNRGVTVPLRGLPWLVLIVLGILVMWSALLSRTRFGRYVYAIGGNAEAARRAGINLARVRTLAFTLCGLTAGAAGIVLESYLGSMSTDLNGGQYVLFAVAAAVIGGTQLFGGHGKMLHALLGGLVVATVYNGLYLIGMSAAATEIVTALVLLAAVLVDTLTRRGRSA